MSFKVFNNIYCYFINYRIVSKLSQERIKKEFRERSRDKADRSSRYVQSSGIFSEGASNILMKRNISHSHSDDVSNSTPAISMPTINKNIDWEVWQDILLKQIIVVHFYR